MLGSKLLLTILVGLSLAYQSIGIYDSGLDPAPLKWWQTKWNYNPIVLSNNNIQYGSTSPNVVSVTFNFNPSTTVSSGVFEVTFPTGFTVTSAGYVNSAGTNVAATVSSQVVQVPFSGTSGTDTSVMITGVSLPTTAGGYGPFALRTRAYSGGQTLDINLAFGSVGLFAATGSLTSLTVSLTSTSSSIVGGTGSTLMFSFQISQDLWKYDIFKITASQYWTISTSAACSSGTTTGKINNFNGTSSSSPHSLDSYVSPKTTADVTSQIIYIYGLAQDIDVAATSDNTYVILYVSGVTNPDAAYATSSYSWTVDTVRGQTYTVLQTATVTNGPTVTTGTIVSASHAPYWGWSNSYIATGTTIYITYSFTTINAIPQGGYATVLFTDTPTTYPNPPGSASPSVWVTNYSTYTASGSSYVTTAAVSSNTVQISNINSMSAASTLSFSVNMQYNQTPAAGSSCTTVNTYTKSGGSGIDSGSSIGCLVVGTTTVTKFTSSAIYVSSSATSFSLVSGSATLTSFSTSPNYYSGGPNSSNAAFVLQFQPSTQFTSTVLFTVKAPFVTTGTTSSFEFVFLTPSYYFSTSTNTGTVTASAVSSPSVTSATTGGLYATTSLGSISFKAGSGATLTSAYAYLMIVPSGTAGVSNPLYASNVATRYEIEISAVDTATSNPIATQTGVLQFSIVENDFASGTGIFCGGVSGFYPLRVNFQPTVYNIPTAPSGATFYIEIQFSQGIDSQLGSGLPNGSAYPGQYSTSFISSLILNSNSAQQQALSLMGTLAAGITTTLAQYLYTTVVFNSANAATIDVIAYYLITADPRNAYEIMSLSSAVSVTSAILSTASTSLTVAAGNTNTYAIAISQSVSSAYGSDNGLILTLGTGKSSTTWAVSFPLGWTIPSTTTLVSSQGPATGSSTIVISPSSSSTTQYMFKLTTLITTLATAVTASTFTITGVTSPAFTSTVSIIFGFAGSTAAWTSVACTDVFTPTTPSGHTYTYTQGIISGVTVASSSVKGCGPSSVNLTQTVTFSTQHFIPAGGSVQVTIDSGWGFITSLNSIAIGTATASGITYTASTQAMPNPTISGLVITFNGLSAVTSGSSIVVTITGLLPPTNTNAATQTSVSFIDSITTNYVISSTSYIIDSTNAAVTTSVTTANSYGRSTVAMSKTYPMYAGATGAHLYLKFSLQNSIPAGGLVAFTSPLAFTLSSSTTFLSNYVWTSGLTYSAVSFSGSTLTFVVGVAYTAGTTIELFIDNGVNNPSSTTTTTTGFNFVSSWSTCTIDSDTAQTSVLAANEFTAASALSTTLTPLSTGSLSFYPTNAGDAATYTFSFTSSVAFLATDQIWIYFPPQFDSYLGANAASVWLSNESSTYYLTVSSSALGSTTTTSTTPTLVWAKVDHNIVVITGTNSVLASTAISISLYNVVNPPTGTTSNFQIFHTDSSGNAKSANQAFGTVTTTAPAMNIQVRSITPSVTDLFDSGSYNFTFYLNSDTISTTKQILVKFPQEYQLTYVDGVSTYTLSTSWADHSSSSTTRTTQSWNSATTASVSGNIVTVSPPTTSKTFASTNAIYVVLSGVGTPQWAQTRVAATGWDFDDTDSTVWTLYSYWTSQFHLFVYDTASSAMSYSSRTYGVLNRAYLGFNEVRSPLYVNGYNPQNKSSRIVVYAGTQTTDITISTSSATAPLSSKSIVFTPTTNARTSDSGKLTYTSVKNSFTLYQYTNSIVFRLGAAITLTKGLYYINWAITEATQPGVTGHAYDKPANTLVEVIAQTSSVYTFTVGTIPTLSEGGTTAPIMISTSNAPHSDVTITLTITASATGTTSGLSVNPSSITFTPDNTFNYFTISATSAANSTSNSVSFALSGTDAAVYTIASTATFVLTSSTPTTAGVITSWGVGTTTATSATFSPTTDQVGTIYYQFSAAGTAIGTLSSLMSTVGTLVYSANTTTYQARSYNTTDSIWTQTTTDPNTNETWAAFQQRIYKTHLETVWYGAVAQTTTTNANTISYTNLYASTQYQIAGYNYNGFYSNSTVHTEYATTSTLASSQPLTIKFVGTVLSTYSTIILDILAEVVGVNPSQFSGFTVSTSSSRRLDSRDLQTTSAYTNFATTLYANRASSLSPTTLTTLSSTQNTNFASLILAAGITNTMSSITLGSIQTAIVPTWVTSPAQQSVANNQITISLQSSTAGQTVCEASAQSYSSALPTPSQVFLGLNVNNTAVPYTTITTTVGTLNNLTITGLTQATAYYVYCVAVDTIPIWPTQMSYPNGVPALSITTSGTTANTTSSASFMTAFFSLLALALFI